ncbi:hypothetical protein ACNF42_07535 [Cuniculiplasma sp. SKW3]|uniref:hypothetical protein n=1 Tax=Cuniculiplasma sp. SKW3 TaxID=3400170 RepID=UPI003FD2FF16
MNLKIFITKLGYVISITIVIILAGALSLAVSLNPNVSSPFWSAFFSILGTSLIIAGIVGVIAELWLHTYAKEQITEHIIKELSTKHQDTIAQLMKFGLSVWLKRENFDIVGLDNEDVAKLYEENLLREFSEPVVKSYNLELTLLEKTEQNDDFISIKENLTQFLVNTWGYDSTHVKYINGNGIIRSFILELYGPDRDFYLTKDKKEIEEKLSSFYQYKLSFYSAENKEETIIPEILPVEIEKKDIGNSSRMSFDEIRKILINYSRSEPSLETVYILYSIDRNSEPPLLYTWDVLLRGLMPREELKIEFTSIKTYISRDYYYGYTRSFTKSILVQLINFGNFETRIEPYVIPRKFREIISEPNILQINYPTLPNAGILIVWNKKP